MAQEVLTLVGLAPLYHPTTPGGRPMSVAMTNLGARGWMSDKNGYRYLTTHPVTGAPWPAMRASGAKAAMPASIRSRSAARRAASPGAVVSGQ